MKINETVLICEKNRGFLTALTLLVQKEFEEVITECDHENITKILQEKEVGIIVLDTGANLPSEQKEHLDFIKEICALGRDIQIVVFTNFSQNPFGLQASDAGAFDFVSKPWNNEKLTVTLRIAHKMRKLSLALKNGKGDTAGTLEEMERKMMESALEKQRGNVTLAAAQLGITRQTLNNKGKKYNLFK
jgi:DNA-binding NtrC family response regulator